MGRDGVKYWWNAENGTAQPGAAERTKAQGLGVACLCYSTPSDNWRPCIYLPETSARPNSKQRSECLATVDAGGRDWVYITGLVARRQGYPPAVVRLLARYSWNAAPSVESHVR